MYVCDQCASSTLWSRLDSTSTDYTTEYCDPKWSRFSTLGEPQSRRALGDTLPAELCAHLHLRTLLVTSECPRNAGAGALPPSPDPVKSDHAVIRPSFAISGLSVFVVRHAHSGRLLFEWPSFTFLALESCVQRWSWPGCWRLVEWCFAARHCQGRTTTFDSHCPTS